MRRTRMLPRLPGTRLGVFTTVEAVAAGWTPKALVRAVEAGRLERIRRGAFAAPLAERSDAADITLARKSVAAALVIPGVHVSHLGAAVSLGLPVWAADPRACATTVDRSLTSLRGLHLHRTTNPPHPSSRRSDPSASSVDEPRIGVRAADSPPTDRHPTHPAITPRVTSAAQTVVDIAREFGTESALVSADPAIARGLLSTTSLAGAVDRSAGRHGAAHARLLAELIDSTSESPLESRSRWAIALTDLPKPWTQVEMFSALGAWVGRVDFFWPCGVVGEVDGSTKYTDPAALRREKWRQEALERLGLIVVRWGARDLLAFGPTARRLSYAIESQRVGARGHDWRAVPPIVTYPA